MILLSFLCPAPTVPRPLLPINANVMVGLSNRSRTYLRAVHCRPIFTSVFCHRPTLPRSHRSPWMSTGPSLHNVAPWCVPINAFVFVPSSFRAFSFCWCWSFGACFLLVHSRQDRSPRRAVHVFHTRNRTSLLTTWATAGGRKQERRP